jgi:ubiquinone/menaquinone biosynthesis C-methylase UbiE
MRAMRKFKSENLPNKLTRARAQKIPLPTGVIGTVFATFPSEYIFDPSTLEEVWRVLKQGGTFSFILMAEPSGNTFTENLVRRLFRITGESGDLDPTWLEPLQDVGFKAHFMTVESVSSNVNLVIASKAPIPAQDDLKNQTVQ